MVKSLGLIKIIPILILLFPALDLQGQKVLLIERYGRAKTQRIYIGDEVRYRLKGEKEFRLGYIEDLRLDTNLIVFGRRYVNPEQVDAFQYDVKWTRPTGISLMVFGLGWSFFAGVADLADLGYQYKASDAIVTGTSIGLGFIISRFRKKKIRFGKKRRLRIVDLSPISNRP